MSSLTNPFARQHIDATQSFESGNPDAIKDTYRRLGDYLLDRYADESAPGIMCDDTIEHLPDDRLGTAELARVLHEDGVVVMATPNRQSAQVLLRRARDLLRGRRRPPEYYYAASSHLREYFAWRLRGRCHRGPRDDPWQRSVPNVPAVRNDSTARVAVVVPVRDGGGDLDACLASLSPQVAGAGGELIVVDDEERSSEDAELYWRAQLEGLGSVVVAPDSVMHLEPRSSVREIWAQWRRYARGTVNLRSRFEAQGATMRAPRRPRQIARAVAGRLKRGLIGPDRDPLVELTDSVRFVGFGMSYRAAFRKISRSR